MARDQYIVREDYIGADNLATYTFDFKIESSNYLLIKKYTSLGVLDWEVRGDAIGLNVIGLTFDAINGGGSITLAENLPVGHTLVLLLAPDAPTQPSMFGGNSIRPKAFEAAFDRLGGQIQRLAYKTDKSLKSDDIDSIDMTLPPVTGNEGRVVAISVDGTAVAYGPTIATIEAAESFAQAAGVDADLAAAAAQAATDAETAAAAALEAAEDAEDAAAASALSAEDAATAAQAAADSIGTGVADATAAMAAAEAAALAAGGSATAALSHSQNAEASAEAAAQYVSGAQSLTTQAAASASDAAASASTAIDYADEAYNARVEAETARDEAVAAAENAGVVSYTQAEIDALTTMVEGDVVYNSTTKTLNIYDGTEWIEVSGSSGGATDGINFNPDPFFQTSGDWTEVGSGNTLVENPNATDFYGSTQPGMISLSKSGIVTGGGIHRTFDIPAIARNAGFLEITFVAKSVLGMSEGALKLDAYENSFAGTTLDFLEDGTRDLEMVAAGDFRWFRRRVKILSTTTSVNIALRWFSYDADDQDVSITRLKISTDDQLFLKDPSLVGSLSILGYDGVPDNHLECNGALVNIAEYPELYAKLQTTWGGDGVTTFGLPNLETDGRFIRSKTASVPVGTYQDDATAKNGLSATTANDTHNHTIGGEERLRDSGGFSVSYLNPSYSAVWSTNNDTHNHAVTISSSDTETRPTNASFKVVIRARKDFEGVLSLQEVSKTLAKVKASASGAVTIPHNVSTIINFDSVLVDTIGGVTTGANWKLVPEVSGEFLVSIRVSANDNAGWEQREMLYVDAFVNNSFAERIALTFLDSSDPAVDSSFDIHAVGTAIVTVEAGQSLDIRAYQNSDATIDLDDAHLKIAQIPDQSSMLAAYYDGLNTRMPEVEREYAQRSGIDYAADTHVPIVASGSNSDGFWIRYADGTQICESKPRVSSTITAGAGGEHSWTYPIEFSSYPSVNVSTGFGTSQTDGRASRIHCGLASTPLTTVARIHFWNDWGTSLAASYYAIAIGRWK